MRASFKEFAFGLVIAILLVYLAMVAQLRSFSTPMVILVSIPLAFVGVAVVLFVTGTNLSIPAFMGIIMVTGIVVEYAIILLEFANQRIRDGGPGERRDPRRLQGRELRSRPRVFVVPGIRPRKTRSSRKVDPRL